MTATEHPRMATAYHETLGGFRGELVSTALDFERMKDGHARIVHAASAANTIDELPSAVRHAYIAALMAAHYGYTIAAILGVAERKFGLEVAEHLAAVANDILMNGDDHDRNADVMREAAVYSDDAT